MIEARITDPKSVSARDVQRILDAGRSPTVQFSRSGYDIEALKGVNRLCRDFGAILEVRFYGHYGEGFDARALSHLPDVKWLSIDCLDQIHHEEQLLKLGLLERLSFGVHRFDKPDFLAGFNFERMTELRLSETAKRNFDLSSLERCHLLTDLFVQGHTRNIDMLTSLPRLNTLSLSGMPKRLELSFVKNIRGLQTLSLLLGSRASIDEVSHDGLEELRIVWVRGLETLGDLHRFPALRVLRVDKQLQLRNIAILGPRLRELFVSDCKNLEEIVGFEEQTELEHFRTSRTRLNLDRLLYRAWPKSMRIVALYSGSEKWNKSARAVLDERGYSEFGDPQT